MNLGAFKNQKIIQYVLTAPGADPEFSEGGV